MQNTVTLPELRAGELGGPARRLKSRATAIRIAEQSRPASAGFQPAQAGFAAVLPRLQPLGRVVTDVMRTNDTGHWMALTRSPTIEAIEFWRMQTNETNISHADLFDRVNFCIAGFCQH